MARAKYTLRNTSSYKIGTRTRGKRVSPKYGKKSTASCSATSSQAKRFGFTKKHERNVYPGRAFTSRRYVVKSKNKKFK